MLHERDEDIEAEHRCLYHQTSNPKGNAVEIRNVRALSSDTSHLDDVISGLPSWTRIRTPSPDNSYAARLAAKGMDGSQLVSRAQWTQTILPHVCPMQLASRCHRSFLATDVFREDDAFIRGLPMPGSSTRLQVLSRRGVGDTLSNSTCSTDVASSAGTSEGLAEAEVTCAAGQLGLLGSHIPAEGLGRGSHSRSRGSAGHPDFCGKPCPFVASRRGCMDGAKCSRCHLCPQRRPRKRKGLQ